MLKADDGLSSADRATVDEIINATVKVITSQEFFDQLSTLEMPRLWRSPMGRSLTPAATAQIYLGKHPSMRPVPAVVTVDTAAETPTTGFTYDTRLTAEITLTTDELDRWRSGTVEGKSCAVNTLAHEITHTVSKRADRGDFLFADRGRGMATFVNRPLVSYVVGSVAQCTMLASRDPLTVCVESWGTNVFKSHGCGVPTA